MRRRRSAAFHTAMRARLAGCGGDLLGTGLLGALQSAHDVGEAAADAPFAEGVDELAQVLRGAGFPWSSIAVAATKSRRVICATSLPMSWVSPRRNPTCLAAQ